MGQPTSNGQASSRRNPLLPLGTVATTALMTSLCIPLAGYVLWLHDRHGPATRLAELALLELLPAMGLLALPFVVLRLLRIDWQVDR